jgi:hypothetical protein
VRRASEERFVLFDQIREPTEAAAIERALIALFDATR